MGYPHYRCTTGEIPQKPSLGGGRGMQAKVPWVAASQIYIQIAKLITIGNQKSIFFYQPNKISFN